MNKTYKTLLTKAFTLSKSYTGENGDKHWPAKVLDILEVKYHLLPKDILRLWYVQRRISAGTLNIDSIYIYDRAMSREQNIPISDYRDLSKNYKLLLFKGNIFQDGSVHLEKACPTLP